MAGRSETGTVDENAPPPEVNLAAHERTFEAFVSLTKWTCVFIALLLIGMAVFLL